MAVVGPLEANLRVSPRLLNHACQMVSVVKHGTGERLGLVGDRDRRVTGAAASINGHAVVLAQVSRHLRRPVAVGLACPARGSRWGASCRRRSDAIACDLDPPVDEIPVGTAEGGPRSGQGRDESYLDLVAHSTLAAVVVVLPAAVVAVVEAPAAVVVVVAWPAVVVSSSLLRMLRACREARSDPMVAPARPATRGTPCGCIAVRSIVPNRRRL